MSTRTYLLVGLVVALLVFAISFFFGPDIVGWARAAQTRAYFAGQNGFGRLVTEPLIFAMTQELPTAILVVFLWPVALAWPLVVLLMEIIIAATGVATDLESQTRVLLRMLA